MKINKKKVLGIYETKVILERQQRIGMIIYRGEPCQKVPITKII